MQVHTGDEMTDVLTIPAPEAVVDADTVTSDPVAPADVVEEAPVVAEVTQAPEPPPVVDKPKAKRETRAEREAKKAEAIAANPHGRLTHVVIRRFRGAGVDRFPGEVVDASTWHAENLVNARRLRPLTIDDPVAIEATGRYFINDDALIAYAESVLAEADADADQSEEG